MTIVLSTLALVAAVLIGLPLIFFGGGALAYVIGASGGRPNPNDVAVSGLLLLAGVVAIIAAAFNLGTRL